MGLVDIIAIQVKRFSIHRKCRLGKSIKNEYGPLPDFPVKLTSHEFLIGIIEPARVLTIDELFSVIGKCDPATHPITVFSQFARGKNSRCISRRFLSEISMGTVP